MTMKGTVKLDEYLPFTATMGAAGRASLPPVVQKKLCLKPGVKLLGFIKVIK